MIKPRAAAIGLDRSFELALRGDITVVAATTITALKIKNLAAFAAGTTS